MQWHLCSVSYCIGHHCPTVDRWYVARIYSRNAMGRPWGGRHVGECKETGGCEKGTTQASSWSRRLRFASARPGGGETCVFRALVFSRVTTTSGGIIWRVRRLSACCCICCIELRCWLVGLLLGISICYSDAVCTCRCQWPLPSMKKMYKRMSQSNHCLHNMRLSNCSVRDIDNQTHYRFGYNTAMHCYVVFVSVHLRNTFFSTNHICVIVDN